MRKFINKLAEKLAPGPETKEYRRLLAMERYTPGISGYWGFPMHFADACTYLHGGEEIFRKEIYRFETSSASPVIIDCGANIGLSVVYFKRLFPEARITAFEPDRQIFEVLKKNVSELQFENIKLEQKAVWTENGTIEFQVEGGFSGRIPKQDDKNNLVVVPSVRLKDLLNSPVDFLKIDIEGAEYAVLQDCRDVLQSVGKIFIEYHSHIHEPQRLNEILTILTDSGFRYHIQEAYVRQRPFVDKDLMLGMDLQLNIFGYRNVPTA